MKEHPILFTGPMVRAILEGRKTQTRRPIKMPDHESVDRVAYDAERGTLELGITLEGNTAGMGWVRAPFAVGDRLWVRETWCQQADSLTERLIAGKAHYAADGYEVHNVDGLERSPWRPSIHMPRWASRLTLEVTDIRPERVKNIPQSDALAEGIEYRLAGGMSPGGSGTYHVGEEHHASTPKEAFACLWDSIYGDGPLAWNTNPWVWATTFKVVKP